MKSLKCEPISTNPIVGYEIRKETTPMNTYLLIIRSHCEAPDYEDEVEAPNKKEAIKYFMSKINQGQDDYWDESMIEEQMGRVYKNGSIR